MENFDLQFKFKGGRRYVHGTDIYTTVVEKLKGGLDIVDIDLSFHKIITSQLKGELLPADVKSGNTESPAAIFKFKTARSETFIVRLFETGKAVTDEYPYDEDTIVDAAVTDPEGKNIELSTPLPYRTIEKVVALNKGLLNKLFTDSGKWYFTRITAFKDIETEQLSTIKITLEKNIGSKITKSLIEFDNRPVGYIYFSKV